MYARKFGLKYTEFKKDTENGREYPVYFLVGEDAYFRERGLLLLKKVFVSEPSLNYAVFDGGTTELSEILTSANSYPFMSKKRMSVVKEFYPKADDFKKGLKDYLENPSADNVLVIINERPCDALTKYDGVCTVECDKADTGLLTRWITAQCGKSGVAITHETAATLCDFCLSDMYRIETETHKLIDYVGAGGTIDESVINLLVSRDSDFKVFEMTDHIAKRRFNMAVTVINEMLNKGEPPFKILASVYNYYRKLLYASVSGKTPKELAEALGIKEYPAKKITEQARVFKKRSLKKAVDFLADADYRIKSGKADADETLWITVFEIMVS